MKYLIFFFFSTFIYAQNTLSGNVLSESDFVLQNVTVVNVKTGNKTLTNNDGNFSIEADVNDEIRFIKENFERGSKVVQNSDFFTPLSIQLVRVPTEIEEVKVAVKPTGNLGKDTNRLKVDHSKDILQKEIGLPQPKGIQREKVPKSLPLAIATLNIDAIYKLTSGTARKMKTMYKYEDKQRNINWITEHNGDEYFTQRGIPKERIREFVDFSIVIEPLIPQYIKSNNLSAVNFILEKTTFIYIERSKK
ncbi:hypothetical protein ACP3T3_11820 [Chryseobacterium sp. CBSDS_008]|uniref:hypothetical protein n=1 Tax=Chryseobacterium sp. CBSDS_008 TaxID=3415265 RepID=UPI003CE767F5